MREEQQISSGTGAGGGAEAGLGPVGWTWTSTCRTTSFTTWNMVSCSSLPCLHASNGTNGLRKESGTWSWSGRLSRQRSFRRTSMKMKLRSPGGSPLRLRREGSLKRRRSDSGKVHLLSEQRLKGRIPSGGEHESKHWSEDDEETVLGGWNHLEGEPTSYSLDVRVSDLRREKERPEPQNADNQLGYRVLSSPLWELHKDLRPESRQFHRCIGDGRCWSWSWWRKKLANIFQLRRFADLGIPLTYDEKLKFCNCFSLVLNKLKIKLNKFTHGF